MSFKQYHMQYNTVIIITLLVGSISSQIVEFDPSLNDTIYIDRSQKVVTLNVVRTGSVHGNVTNVRVAYNTTSNRNLNIIPFYNSTGIITFDEDSIQSIKLILMDDAFELDDDYTIKLHLSGDATLGKKDTIKLRRNNFLFTSISPIDADSLKTHQVDKFGQQKEDLQVNSRTNIESFLQDRNQVKKRAITDTSTGCEFFVGFIPNFGAPSTLTLFTSSEELISYSIEAPMTGFFRSGTLTSNIQNIFTLPSVLTGPSFYFPNGENNSSKEGVRIHTAEDKLLVIGSMGSHNFETFFAIPTINFCLREYVYFGISVTTNVRSDGSIVIIGTANHTIINVNVPVLAVIKLSNSAAWGSIFADTLYSFEIQRQQIIYIAALVTDLTGTKVTSNKPISLFSGHECAFVPYLTESCDPLIEQMPPTKLWSTVHYFAPIATRMSYTVKIVAAYDSTTVDIYCNNTLSSHMINAGEFITTEYDNQEYCGVYASNDVLVSQFSHSYDSDMRGHAMMTLIPATTHYANKITSSTSQFNPSGANHYINIIVLPNYYQPEQISITTARGLTQSLSSNNWVPVRRNGVVEAYTTQVNITTLVNITHSVFEVTHSNKTALMSVIVYGFITPRAYGHPGWIKSEFNVDLILEQHNTVESNGYVEIEVTLSVGTFTTPVTGMIRSTEQSPISAISDVDYTEGRMNVTLPAEANSQTFRINVIDDNIIECSETFIVMIESVSPCGVTNGIVNSTEIIIIDDDNGEVSLEHSSYSVVERNGLSSLTITMSVVASHDVIVEVTVTDGTATAGVDYTVTTSVFNVTISAGATSSSFNIDIIDDVTHEDSETFNVAIRLIPSCLSLSLGISSSTVTIIDNDVTVLCIKELSISTSEHQGIVTVTITTNTSSTDITITVITTDTTATGGDDYEAGSFSVAIPAGEISVPFNISIIDDNIFEENETFTVTVDSSSLPSRVLLQPDCMAMITIVDDDAITVRFDRGIYIVQEGVSIIQPLLALNSSSPLIEMVQVINTDITAKGGVDYNSGPYNVTFPVGSTNASFDIMINIDSVLENDEMFNISITSISNDHIVGTPGVATVTIIDTTTTMICFNKSSVSTNEDRGSLMFTLNLTNPSSTDMTVTVITTDGTATGGDDYETGPFSITIPAGEISVPFNISIIDDNIFEANESFSLTIDSSSLPSRVSVQPDCMAMITIVDDDAISVRFDSTTYTINEDVRIAHPLLVLSNPSSFNETVQVINIDVTANEGVDYNSGPYNVTFPVGSTTASFDIVINENSVLENNKMFNISITSITNDHIVDTPGVATVIIIDTTTTMICFNKSSVSTNENRGSLMFTLNLTNPSSSDMTVTVMATDGTATRGDDYEPGPFSITIPAGEISVPFNISLIDDNIFEANESFSLTIDSTSLPSRVSVQPDCMAMITIVDDDVITVKFHNATYTVDEDNGIIRPLLVLSNPSSFVETVQVINTDITTNGSNDYDTGPYTVTFPIQSTDASLIITVNDDSISEDNEAFNISITSITNGHIVGTPGVATVTIIDITGLTTSRNAIPTAAIAGGVGGGIIVVIFLIALCSVLYCVLTCYKKKSPRNNIPQLEMTVFNNKNIEKRFTAAVNSGLEETVSLPKKKLSEYMVDYNHLTIQSEISRGNFGVVCNGVYTKENKQIKVAIKTLKVIDITLSNSQHVIEECNIMTELDHPNVLKLIGVSVNPEDATLHIVMPFMHYGDVRSFLKNKRGNVIELDQFPKDLSCYILMNMCLEIAKGMEYLSSKHFVHRDLAARNCMLDKNFIINVADFGLSRDVYMNNYYKAKECTALPVKWLAPEALYDQTYNEKTDVWSFGVTCWEIFSFGIQPYPSIDSSEIGDYVKNRNVLNKPFLSPDEFYGIMRSCWNFQPEGRPRFTELVQTISQQLELLKEQTPRSLQIYLSTNYLKVYNH